MDRQLLKDKEAFKKRALLNPVVESRKKRVEHSTGESSKKKSSKSVTNPSLKSVGSNQNFNVLAKVVRHMKTRHLEGETHPLTIEEMLDETNLLHIGNKTRHWLVNEALPSNIRIQIVDGKYFYKPALNIRDKNSLRKLLRQHDIKGYGGILLEEIQESLPHCEKVMKAIDKEILMISRQDKKQIVFYQDKSVQFPVEKEFQQLWRNTSVDGLQDDNIEEYLNKQGIKSMQDTHSKSSVPNRRKVKSRKLRPTKICDNEHLSSVLKDYDDA